MVGYGKTWWATVHGSQRLGLNTHTHNIHTCHIFIHSSIDGHLGCFHILAIVNNAIYCLIGVFFHLGKYPEVELLDHIVVYF